MSDTVKQPETLDDIRTLLWEQYGGENKRITDADYDRTLAVKCINGIFVGRKTENVVMYRGIPYVGRQPVGELRWKAPVEAVPDDGVYEAFYNAKSSWRRLPHCSSCRMIRNMDLSQKQEYMKKAILKGIGTNTFEISYTGRVPWGEWIYIILLFYATEVHCITLLQRRD